MIELKTAFTKKGKSYEQLLKTEKCFLYRVSYSRADGGEGHYYELFKRVVKGPDIYHDDEWELYPCDELFGKYAWCCSTVPHLLKVAREKLSDMEAIYSVEKMFSGGEY